MFTPRFNSRPVVGPRKPKTGGSSHYQGESLMSSGNFVVLDAGFDDIAAGPSDVMVAPGVMAHFSRLEHGSLHGSRYQAGPLFERIDNGG